MSKSTLKVAKTEWFGNKGIETIEFNGTRSYRVIRLDRLETRKILMITKEYERAKKEVQD